MNKLRLWIQIGFTAISNGFYKGFLGGGLYQGPLKQLCLPGLNCYSCPGALGSCPIGALQAVISSRSFDFSFYVVGFLLAFGALGGRIVCGFLCPFGLVQDLIYRIPIRKIKHIPFSNALNWLRYIVLLLLVIILPMFAVNIIGQGDPWFCKVLCPSGTLMAGIPQLLINPDYQSAIGPLFFLKLSILLMIIVLSITIYRPFCRFLCPLGAIYGLFNPLSLYRHKHIVAQCTHCNACHNACPIGLDPIKKPNDPKCIRCGACIKACNQKALLPFIARR